MPGLERSAKYELTYSVKGHHRAPSPILHVMLDPKTITRSGTNRTTCCACLKKSRAMAKGAASLEVIRASDVDHQPQGSLQALADRLADGLQHLDAGIPFAVRFNDRPRCVRRGGAVQHLLNGVAVLIQLLPISPFRAVLLPTVVVSFPLAPKPAAAARRDRCAARTLVRPPQSAPVAAPSR